MVRSTRWVMTARGQPFVKEEIETSAPGPDEALIEIAGCGVCHTDLGYYYDGVRTNHALPLTLGHEISGRVLEAGSDALWWSDRAVIVPAVIPCGRCDACRRGKATICPSQKMPGNDIHGGFATHIVVPAEGLCAVDDQRRAVARIDLADLPVVADAVTTPYQAVVQAGVTDGDLVVVNGVGGVGGYAAQALNMMTEARAGFRAFEGTRETGREVDFIALRRALAANTPWSDELTEQIQPGARGQ